jgi:phosphatidylethanolamine-binding protein (PEBP) family uncharacterized protein
LHALDIPSLRLARDAGRDEVEARMSAHILNTAQLVGTYQRRERTRAAGA